MNTRDNILIANDIPELAAEFVSIVSEAAAAAISQTDRFTIALSGGSTPKLLYPFLVDADIDWHRAYFFFGDERLVPPSDGESNFGMADLVLLRPLHIPPARIFRWSTELQVPALIAKTYDEQISVFFGGGPRFDLCLLGLGADGHTASLFPFTAALAEKSSAAVANWVPKLDRFRFTLTPDAINNSNEILFVATGAEKAPAVRAVIEGPADKTEFPAKTIDPVKGRLRWLLDGPAASLLSIE